MNAIQLYSSYKEQNFFFCPTIITRYTLAMYSKPFVILSGISGTGKTKIAQLFPLPLENKTVQNKDVSTNTGRPKRLLFRATTGMRSGDGRGNISKEYLNVVFESKELSLIKNRIEDLKGTGREDNIIDPIEITIITPNNEELIFGLYVQRPSSPLIRIRAKSKKGEQRQYDSQDYLLRHYKNNDVIELEKISPYKFKIISAQNVEEKAASESVLNDQEQSNYGHENKLFISVQSNWTDRSELFGFFNQIEGIYNSTPLLKFIQMAADNPSIPYFLILDEMNLSKVEHYFSDFLSCLESRVVKLDGVYQEPIHLHSKGEFVSADDPLVEQVPSKLYLPLNLYVTGTVNVDETTYMFSPKVLDRANVIEFNEVDLGLLEGNTPPHDGLNVLNTVPLFGEVLPVTSKDYQDAPADVQKILQSFIDILKPFSMHFGYRVAQEICRYINAARKYIDDKNNVIISSLDAQIVQKILPKFSGSQAQIEEPLRRILYLLLQDNGKELGIVAEQMTIKWLNENKKILEDSSYPLATNKLHRMLNDLHVRGFTNFIG